MGFRAVVFDIGGVLEFTPPMGMAEEMIFLDDVEPNVAAAQDLGAHGILFVNTTQAITDIEAALNP